MNISLFGGNEKHVMAGSPCQNQAGNPAEQVRPDHFASCDGEQTL
jgi:hypothetical protein